jgi:hypothetical protein
MSKLYIKRKLIFGWAVNDAPFPVTWYDENGKRVHHPIYDTWHSMVGRCHDAKFQARRPTYIGCTIAEEWKYFTAFYRWMKSQKWRDKNGKKLELDKDLAFPGNKVYGPDTCHFVSREINLLLGDNGAKRGKYPQGVSLYKPLGKYRVQIKKYNKRHHIGYYKTPEEASQAYRIAKAEYIREVASTQDDYVKEKLNERADDLEAPVLSAA